MKLSPAEKVVAKRAVSLEAQRLQHFHRTFVELCGLGANLVQSQILNLLKSLQETLNLTFLFVTHHLLVVKYISDRAAVMYLGKIMEIADTATIFSRPVHPYTHALLSAIPIPDVEHKQRRIVLSGDVPSPVKPPRGCRFHTRCPFTLDRCREQEPLLEEVGNGHKVACHRQNQVENLIAERYGRKAL